MMTKQIKEKTIYALCVLAIGAFSPVSWAQSSKTESGSQQSSKSSDAMQQVNNATQTVKQMETDPRLRKLMQQAKGLFIVPKYGRAGLGIGGAGGEGVLLVNNQGKWSNPAFYNFGGISIGLQAGVEGGSIAMLLMNQKAVNSFMEKNKFSLTADAGLTIVNYDAKAGASAGSGDIIAWSSTKGAFAGATVGLNDIHFDEEDNASFYKTTNITARDIISGKVKSARSTPLTEELSSGS